jgi:antagonist of KipI
VRRRAVAVSAGLSVVRPGLLTTVQDLGRWGSQALGVPVSGAMDTMAHRLANALVGNAAGMATLEVTLIGPELRAERPLVAAVAGAEFVVTVDDRIVAHQTPFALARGSTLRFGERRRASRAYLAVAGGIDTAVVLGSRATHLVSGMGGLNGRALVKGDVLPVGVSARADVPPPAGPVGWPDAPPPPTLRVLLGPQDGWFSRPSLDTLLHDEFRVSTTSNRMGFRLDGPALTAVRLEELLSEPVPFGAIQVPAGGAPILLMADRQTAGGYPKIATVITADLPLAGQLGPGDAVRFAACTRAEARAALIARERELLRAMPEGAGA